MRLLQKIFLSWAIGLICLILAKEVIKKSMEFSVTFGASLALIFTVYFMVDYYGWFKMIAEKIKEFGESVEDFVIKRRI